jgi:hypothetical protein
LTTPVFPLDWIDSAPHNWLVAWAEARVGIVDRLTTAFPFVVADPFPHFSRFVAFRADADVDSPHQPERAPLMLKMPALVDISSAEEWPPL